MFMIFQAVRNFILSQPGKFISYLAIHSYGSKIVYPWSSTTEKVLTIYIYTLLVCLSVCLYPINVKTTEPIESKFCVGPRVTLGKDYT